MTRQQRTDAERTWPRCPCCRTRRSTREQLIAHQREQVQLREKGESHEIKSMGALTQEAVKIAEQNGLGVMQNRSGAFRVIRACGLGAYENFFSSLEEVDAFIKNLKK